MKYSGLALSSHPQVPIIPIRFLPGFHHPQLSLSALSVLLHHHRFSLFLSIVFFHIFVKVGMLLYDTIANTNRQIHFLDAGFLKLNAGDGSIQFQNFSGTKTLVMNDSALVIAGKVNLLVVWA